MVIYHDDVGMLTCLIGPSYDIESGDCMVRCSITSQQKIKILHHYSDLSIEIKKKKPPMCYYNK